MITGGNGFLGYAVLVGALKAGVRIPSFINIPRTKIGHTSA